MNTARFNFRVWDDKRKLYILPGDLSIDADGELWENCTYLDNSDNHLIIEQCTGLKDKNGKLIYEGDVISRNNGRWKEIRFYQGGFGWWTEYDCFVSFSGHNHLEEVLQSHEIIGNIHEMESEND